MVILRLAARLALWGLAWLLLALAWMSTASASAFDSRVPWGLAVCGVAWLLIVYIRYNKRQGKS